MINRKLLIGVAVVIVLVVITVVVYRTFFLTYTTNPPVVIVGGSIHAHFPRNWTRDVSNVQYHGQTTNDTAIYTNDVYDQSGTSAPKPISVANGFVINFYDSDPSGSNPRGDAGLALCSSATCDPGTADTDTVYLKVLRSGDQLEEQSPSELHFHSLGLSGHCDQAGNSQESPCDRINHIGIVIGNGQETVYTCGGHTTPAGHCEIGIGHAP
ncbi:MAG TPA: hypothetical protein VJT08_10890 [Terriglobales bacterium]|nr:hypothetical protein [Terriglobales bacterium]